ncbi:hypothetical protein NQ314_011612 [Rhamnusium bicolor]|uniref:Uncharacterized protein n=1 Tax=Rhamnusium bicolor TaxID=1586634 RepID=A0AAV8XH42_9CUCU|nr:hypothetical protein NQ314_011612 [Rhamnusium bicolor]
MRLMWLNRRKYKKAHSAQPNKSKKSAKKTGASKADSVKDGDSRASTPVAEVGKGMDYVDIDVFILFILKLLIRINVYCLLSPYDLVFNDAKVLPYTKYDLTHSILCAFT